MKLLLAFVLRSVGLAESHRFQPTEFSQHLPSAYSGVVRIKPGDDVITSTIDGDGTDAEGARHGGNAGRRSAHGTRCGPLSQLSSVVRRVAPALERAMIEAAGIDSHDVAIAPLPPPRLTGGAAR